MTALLRIVSYIALALTVLPSILYLGGTLTIEATKLWMLIATLIWFAATPFWMDKEKAS